MRYAGRRTDDRNGSCISIKFISYLLVSFRLVSTRLALLIPRRWSTRWDHPGACITVHEAQVEIRQIRYSEIRRQGTVGWEILIPFVLVAKHRLAHAMDFTQHFHQALWEKGKKIKKKRR